MDDKGMFMSTPPPAGGSNSTLPLPTLGSKETSVLCVPRVVRVRLRFGVVVESFGWWLRWRIKQSCLDFMSISTTLKSQWVYRRWAGVSALCGVGLVLLVVATLFCVQIILTQGHTCSGSLIPASDGHASMTVNTDRGKSLTNSLTSPYPIVCMWWVATSAISMRYSSKGLCT